MSDANLVTCEITGKQVPADETILLDGKRVGAEGKAILLERMKSGENGEAQLRPTVWLRFAALFVDGIVIVVPIAIAGGVLGFKTALTADKTAALHDQLVGQHILAVVSGLISFTYLTLMHGTKGQTLGKMACKLKVVTDDGLASITMQQAFFRTVCQDGPQILCSVISAILVLAIAEPAQAITLLVGVVPGVYTLVSIILALTDTNKQRAIHDRLAKTRVVNLNALKQAD